MMKGPGSGHRTTVVLLSVCLLAGCDCLRAVSALVLDAETGKPIKGARVRERFGDGGYEGWYELTSDSGRFEFNDVSGGLKCPPVQLHISKDGFVPVDREFEPGSWQDTVFLHAEPWRYKTR